MSPWKIALPLVVALFGAAAAVASEAVAAEGPLVTPIAAFGCTLSHGQLVCGAVNGHKNKNKHTDDQGEIQMQGQSPCPQGGAAGFAKSKKKPCKQGGNQNSDVGSQGERSCPPGYVVLAEKNKYGSFCEPKEGFPAQAQEQPAEAEKCKFGMLGTPPNNCYCPQGTEFAGFKGCVAVGGGAQNICCTAHLKGGSSGTQCTADYKQTEAEVRKDLQHFAEINNDPSASITCAPK